MLICEFGVFFVCFKKRISQKPQFTILLLCSCTGNYIGESKRNVATRWGEPNNPTHNSETAKHLNKNIQHTYNWKILASASKRTSTRNNLEAAYIAFLRPSLNEQLKSNKLLFLEMA